MLWLANHWRVVVAIACCLAGICLYQIGRHDGRQDAALDAAHAAAKAIQERETIDASIGDFDPYRLCIELGGLQSDCEQLRRVEEGKP